MTEAIRTPVDAEVYAAAWMRHLGFADARETTYSADAGIDVLASQAVAQVKFRTVQVGRPEVQSFVGAAHAHPDKYWLFFSWKGYSSNAIEYAQQAQVALFSYELSGQYAPVNWYAQQLCAAAANAPVQVWQPAAEPAAASWWTTRRILQIALGVVALGVLVFFIANPDAFIKVLVTGAFVLLAWGWVKGTKPESRRRRTRRRR